MHHFFVTPGQVEGEYIRIEGSDVNHIKNVLRLKKGEKIRVSDGSSHSYTGIIDRLESEEAVILIEEREESGTELDSRLYLFQGLPKSDKMELIVQKAVELGVSEIIPVAASRCVVRLDEKKAAKKVERWNGIAESAAKQSGRGVIPSVKEVMTYKAALSYAGKLDINLIPYELAEGMDETREIISGIKSGQSVGIFIGPEGGFEKAEVAEAKEAGVKEITLGKRILRTETAGLAVLSILMYHLEK